MTNVRLAYMPLITYPGLAPDESIIAAVAFAGALGCELQATTFSVKIPPVSSPIGNFLLNIPELIRTTEENSLADCLRLQDLVHRWADGRIKAQCSSKKLMLGLAGNAATIEARYYDVSLVPWAVDNLVIQELAQSVVFDAGRPVILVPPSATSKPIGHVAIAWDGSRVAARALADLMPLLAQNTFITVLTVQNEKPLEAPDIAEALAASLKRRGVQALARNVELGGREIAEALQETALEVGADLMVMGGFGHTRLRDFILGGATKGVFSDLRLPVLFSH
ncbi:universal stress protein [Kaistia defluvii]|uniref:Nucleotide-binding universal stress UspA family protein n=1 Tax=Kaistia defluvii TaxID=410841 RepID=A0ABV2QZD8_9HYPH